MALWIGVQVGRSPDGGTLERDVQVAHVLHIKRPSVTVYALPAPDSVTAGALRRGDRVEVIDRQGEWWKISAEGNLVGWVQRNELLADR